MGRSGRKGRRCRHGQTSPWRDKPPGGRPHQRRLRHRGRRNLRWCNRRNTRTRQGSVAHGLVRRGARRGRRSRPDMGRSGWRRGRRRHGQTSPGRDKPPGGRRRHRGLGHSRPCERRLGNGCHFLRWQCRSLANRPSRRGCDGGLGSNYPRWPPPRLADGRLTVDPWPGFAWPRDEAEVACRRKHRTTGQQQAQGGQRRRPAEACRAPVAGKKLRSQAVPDSLSLCHGQLLQRFGRTHQRYERPQLAVLR